MALTSELYLEQLQRLLPPGAAWPRGTDASLTGVLDMTARSLARIDQRADDVLNEADPRTTFEMLSDWETMAGLPDQCAGPAETFQGRRDTLYNRIVGRGGQSIAFFHDLAARLGFRIIIQEFRLFRAGKNTAGQRVIGFPAAYTWRVRVGGSAMSRFRAGSSMAGEPLASISRNEILECAILRAKPAHTTVVFDYSGGDISLDATLGALRLSATGRHPIGTRGTITLGAATLTGRAGIRVRGVLSRPLGAAALSSTGSAPVLPSDIDGGAATSIDDDLDGGTATSSDDWDVDGGTAFTDRNY